MTPSRNASSNASLTKEMFKSAFAVALVLLSIASTSYSLATSNRDGTISFDVENAPQLVLEQKLANVHTPTSGYSPAKTDHSSPANTLLQSEAYFTQFGIRFDVVSHPAFPEHRLRITQPKLCDPGVQQYSGYLDISETKHLFFWFFEARESPKDAPVIMWLNGGPGCSSTMGLLFEMGPCSIAEGGNSTTYNKHSWTNVANVLFVDQPIGTGFSYSDDGSEPSTHEDITKDLYALLALFFTRFSQYADAPFHLTGESYFGHMGPALASMIHKTNKIIKYAPRPWMKKINLASLVIANGLTDPAHQFATVADYLCEDGPYPPFSPDQPVCIGMKRDTPICVNLIETCQRYSSPLTCLPAVLQCWERLMRPTFDAGLNPYDIRRTCDDPDGKQCYGEVGWVETWMNNASNRLSLGVDDPPRPFENCNMELNKKFFYSGQSMYSSAGYLPDLIDEGVRVLVYAGNADSVCNYLGIERWMLKLVHKFYVEFVDAIPFVYEIPHLGKAGGRVRTAGGHGAGNITFIEVFGAGHMAPHDQPEVALDMITRWIEDKSFRSD